MSRPRKIQRQRSVKRRQTLRLRTTYCAGKRILDRWSSTTEIEVSCHERVFASDSSGRHENKTANSIAPLPGAAGAAVDNECLSLQRSSKHNIVSCVEWHLM